MADRKRGLERRGTPTKPKPSMVPRVAQKDAGPVKNHGSWWANGKPFQVALKDRMVDSWGQFKDIPSTSLAHGENEISRPRAPKPIEFAPGKK